MDKNSQLNFNSLKRSVNMKILPSTLWGYTTDLQNFIALQKLEKNASQNARVRKRIAIFPDLHVKIFFDNQLIPLSEVIIITSVHHLVQLLKVVDKLPLSDD